MMAGGWQRTTELLSANAGWLQTRWAEANRERESGELKRFPRWFFEPPTEPQLQRIRESGVVPMENLTKGQASDIIGLLEPVEQENEDILRFFKVPVKGMNQSRARHEVAQLLADPEKHQAWHQRPAEMLQKEFYRFFDLKVPSRLTYMDAERTIREHREQLEDANSPLLDEWDSFEMICTDLLDADTCETYNLRKPTIVFIRAAIDALRKSGRTLTECGDDLQVVVDKLVELKPDLRRSRD